MKKQFYYFPKVCMLLIIVLLPLSAKADIWDLILGQLEQQTGFQGQIQQFTSELPQITQLNQETLQQLRNTTGVDYANKNYNSTIQSWGQASDNWNGVLSGYQQGGSGLANVAHQLNQQFPIQQGVVNTDSNSSAEQYYQLQAKTALAARAASQMDYDNIKTQIDYMHQLHDLIPQTQTLKDAVDLQNRIQVENNLIQLEILRLSALSNQQQAITTQGQVNAVINNANAFSN